MHVAYPLKSFLLKGPLKKYTSMYLKCSILNALNKKTRFFNTEDQLDVLHATLGHHEYELKCTFNIPSLNFFFLYTHTLVHSSDG